MRDHVKQSLSLCAYAAQRQAQKPMRNRSKNKVLM